MDPFFTWWSLRISAAVRKQDIFLGMYLHSNSAGHFHSNIGGRVNIEEGKVYRQGAHTCSSKFFRHIREQNCYFFFSPQNVFVTVLFGLTELLFLFQKRSKGVCTKGKEAAEVLCGEKVSGRHMMAAGIFQFLLSFVFFLM